jgi:hypothetical protein
MFSSTDDPIATPSYPLPDSCVLIAFANQYRERSEFNPISWIAIEARTLPVAALIG